VIWSYVMVAFFLLGEIWGLPVWARSPVPFQCVLHLV
jgi:hypothetical protein